jgi:hypothetical protein
MPDFTMTEPTLPPLGANILEWCMHPEREPCWRTRSSLWRRSLILLNMP